jgi:hypothetical protein
MTAAPPTRTAVTRPPALSADSRRRLGRPRFALHEFPRVAAVGFRLACGEQAAERDGGRTGCGIFDQAEAETEHARMQALRRRLPVGVDAACAAFGQTRHRSGVRYASRERIAARQRHAEERVAAGSDLGACEDVGSGQAQHRGDGRIVDRSVETRRHGGSEFGEHGLPVADRELHADRPDAFFEHDVAVAFGCGYETLSGEHDRTANRRMPGEGQLARRREDAHAGGVGRIFGREDEDGFRQIHLGGDALHGTVIEAVCARINGERIAGERLVGEYVCNQIGQLHRRPRAGKDAIIHLRGRRSPHAVVAPLLA